MSSKQKITWSKAVKPAGNDSRGKYFIYGQGLEHRVIQPIEDQFPWKREQLKQDDVDEILRNFLRRISILH